MKDDQRRPSIKMEIREPNPNEDEKLKAQCDENVKRLIKHNDFTCLQWLTNTVKTTPSSLNHLQNDLYRMEKHYGQLDHSQKKRQYADFLSFLSTFRESSRNLNRPLNYYLQGEKQDISQWGVQYLDVFADDIRKMYTSKTKKMYMQQKAVQIAKQIAEYYVKTQSEDKAIDLLLDVGELITLSKLISDKNYFKIYKLLISKAKNSISELITQQIYEKLAIVSISSKLSKKKFVTALRLSIKSNVKNGSMTKIFTKCDDQLVSKQLAFIAARYKIFIPSLKNKQIISNSLLPRFYSKLVQQQQIIVPRDPHKIFGNEKFKDYICYFYANGFVNAWLAKDLYLINQESQDCLLLQSDLKDHQKIAAVASIGLISAWNLEGAQTKLMKYFQSQQQCIRAGAILGVGICSAGVGAYYSTKKIIKRLSLKNKKGVQLECSILAVGLSFAGSQAKNYKSQLFQVMVNQDSTLRQSAFAALSLGLCFIGSANKKISLGILQTCKRFQLKNLQLQNHFASYFALGLAFIFMGRKDLCVPILDMNRRSQHPFREVIDILVKSIAYIGCGTEKMIENLIRESLFHQDFVKSEKDYRYSLKRQQQIEKKEKKGKKRIKQISSSQEYEPDNELEDQVGFPKLQYGYLMPLGIALLASKEQKVNEKVIRQIMGMFQYQNEFTKKFQKITPLALVVLYLLNPDKAIIQKLEQLSNSAVGQIAFNSILSLGLINAGTNDEKILQFLQNLVMNDSQNEDHLRVIRISQSLVQFGNGLLKIQPYSSDSFIFSKVGMAGIITFLVSLFDINATFCGQYHYLIYFLTLSMDPRSLFMLNEKLESLSLDVKVGKTEKYGEPIGTQNKMTPFLLQNGQRALRLLSSQFMLAADDCILQDFVIVREKASEDEEGIVERPAQLEQQEGGFEERMGK